MITDKFLRTPKESSLAFAFILKAYTNTYRCSRLEAPKMPVAYDKACMSELIGPIDSCRTEIDRAFKKVKAKNHKEMLASVQSALQSCRQSITKMKD